MKFALEVWFSRDISVILPWQGKKVQEFPRETVIVSRSHGLFLLILFFLRIMFLLNRLCA